MAQTYIHDPQARLDYTQDWSAWLADGETITDASWTVTGYRGDPPDIATVDTTDTASTVWVEDATLGDRLQLTCHIVTSDGREDDRTQNLNVSER